MTMQKPRCAARKFRRRATQPPARHGVPPPSDFAMLARRALHAARIRRARNQRTLRLLRRMPKTDSN